MDEIDFFSIREDLIRMAFDNAANVADEHYRKAAEIHNAHTVVVPIVTNRDIPDVLLASPPCTPLPTKSGNANSAEINHGASTETTNENTYIVAE